MLNLLKLALEGGETFLNMLGKVMNITKVPEILKFGRTMTKPKSKNWIQVNVGGTNFQTTKTTLLSEPDSLFALLVHLEEKEYQDKFAQLDEVAKQSRNYKRG